MWVIICEDERVYSRAIENDILCWKESHMYKDVYVQLYHSAEDLLDAFEKGTRCDLLFLDIRMPDGLNGFELAQIVRESNEKMQIVFISNFNDYLYEGYTLNILRYLPKPVSKDKVIEVLDIVYNQLSSLNGTFFSAKKGGIEFFIPLNDIMYFEVNGHNTLVHRASTIEVQAFRVRIKDVVEQLQQNTFVFSHRSFLVNLAYIRKLRIDSIELVNGVTVPMSRNYADDAKRKIHNYFQGGL